MSRYIDEGAETDIILLLDEWASGKYGPKLTWATLEMASGFTRQALSARARVYDAYVEAKRALGRGGKALPNQQMQDELDRANLKINRLEKEIENYRNLWVLWTYNAQMAGVDLNKPMAKGFKDSQRDR